MYAIHFTCNVFKAFESRTQCKHTIKIGSLSVSPLIKLFYCTENVALAILKAIYHVKCTAMRSACIARRTIHASDIRQSIRH